MNIFLRYFVIFTALLLSSCGGGGDTIETTATTCTSNTQCSTGQVCTNGTCVTSSTTNLSTSVQGYQTCEYYGLTTSGTNCTDGTNTTALTSVRSTVSTWKNMQEVMQIAAAKAVLNNNNKNVNGSGVTISLIGTGVTSVSGVNNVSKDSAGNFVECDGNNQGANGTNVCTYADSNSTSTVSQTSDGSDLANGTMLASILTDTGNNTKGIVSEATINSIQTFVTLTSNFTGTNPDYNSGTKTYAYNGYFGKDLNNNDVTDNNISAGIKKAVDAGNEIILFNNQTKFNNNARSELSTDSIKAYYYGGSCSGNNWCYKEYTSDQLSMLDANNTTVNSNFFADNTIDNISYNVRTQLNSTNQIFITPVDNVIISEVIKDTTSYRTTESYHNVMAVADVNVTGVTYNSTADGNGINQISGIAISSFASTDCSTILSTKCFIAPGGSSVYATNKNGAYTNFNNIGESAASAYVAGGFAMLRNQFSNTSLSDIIAKVATTATGVDKITGCGANSNAVGTVTTTSATYGSQTIAVKANEKCGLGIPNFYKATQSSVTASSANVTNVNGFSTNLAQTSLTSAPAFGNSMNMVAANLANTVYLDDFNFDYNANLHKKINIARANKPYLSSFIASELVTKTNNLDLTPNLSFNLTSKKQQDNYKTIENSFTSDYKNDKVASSLSNLRFNHNIAKVNLEFAYKTAYSNNIYYDNAIKSANHYFSLNNNKDNKILSLSHKLNSKLEFANSWIASDIASLYISKIDFTAHKNTKLSLLLGILHEDNKILGMESTGAFGTNSSNTNYLNLQFLHKIKDINFFASFALGKTKVKLAENSLFSNFSDFSSQEIQLGISKKIANNSIGFNYIEPLRVTSGAVTVTSQSRNNNNEIAFTSHTSKLSPNGKERNYELYFNKNINTNNSLSINLLRITESGHDAHAQTENMAMIRFNKKF